MSTKKRGHNEDSIYKDGDRWRGAISIGYGPNGERLRKKVSGKTRPEVVEKIRKIREGIAKGLPVPDDKITVGAFLDRWLSTLPGHIADSTLDDYEDTVRLHLKPGLGRHKLTALTVAHVDALWQAKREKCKPNSVRIMRAVLRKALGQAEREGLVARNVAAIRPTRTPSLTCSRRWRRRPGSATGARTSYGDKRAATEAISGADLCRWLPGWLPGWLPQRRKRPVRPEKQQGP
jgi:hypothetical protein